MRSLGRKLAYPRAIHALYHAMADIASRWCYWSGLSRRGSGAQDDEAMGDEAGIVRWPTGDRGRSAENMGKEAAESVCHLSKGTGAVSASDSTRSETFCEVVFLFSSRRHTAQQ